MFGTKFLLSNKLDIFPWNFLHLQFVKFQPGFSVALIPIKVGFCDNNGTQGRITLASSVSVGILRELRKLLDLVKSSASFFHLTFQTPVSEMWLLSSLQGNIKKKPSNLILTLLHQFLFALTLAVSSLLFVVFSTLHVLGITQQDSRDFWPWQCCWVRAFQKRTRQRIKDLLLSPTECKGSKIQNTSDGFGERKSHHKELFERSCRDQLLGKERTPGCSGKAAFHGTRALWQGLFNQGCWRPFLSSCGDKGKAHLTLQLFVTL